MSRAVTLEKRPPYHGFRVQMFPAPVPEPDEVLVQFRAAALNHREIWIRQDQYPGIDLDAPLLADGVATVLPPTSGSPSPSPAVRALPPGTRVLLNPGTGWAADPIGPESRFCVIGGCRDTPLGTLQERAAVPAVDLVPAPEHLSDAEAAALPLAGLTAWRALVTKAGAVAWEPARNVLVTGIGGGVALMALALAAARGCRVWVTSSRPEKIRRAEALGAAGGVLYTDDAWPKMLQGLLPKDRPSLDAVIDGAGGAVVVVGCVGPESAGHDPAAWSCATGKRAWGRRRYP